MKGDKHDKDKLKWSLMPFKALEPVLSVLMHGAKKYSIDNWKSVPRANERYFDACLRHVLAWKGGEKKDKESGQSHLAHAVCCLLFLIWFEQKEDKSGVL